MTQRVLLFLSLFFIAGCSLLGVHPKIHNPKRAGKYPERTEARVLLGNQDSKYRTCYDVKYYHLKINFEDDLRKDKAISGVVFISAKALTDIDTLQFDLAENMELGSVAILNTSSTYIILDGDQNEFKTLRKKSAVLVFVNSLVKSGQNFTLEIKFSGEPSEAKKAPWEGGFVRAEDDLKNPWWGVACQTNGASMWWPCKDVMNDEPDSVDVFLTVPQGLKAISNGKLVAQNIMPLCLNHGKSVYGTEFHWHVSYPINIYNITFYIGNYKLLHDTYYSEVTHDTLQLNHYVLEQHYDKAVEHFKQLKKHLAFYETTFGPYPWYRDGFKLVESPYAGMEHQSAIAYGNGFQNDPQNGFDYIILHETAHEWWGNSVTANDLADSWIHEGFATYAEALYVEKTNDHLAYLQYLRNYRFFIINRRPLVGEKGIRYFNYKDSDIYMKGAWTLHSLRYVIANDSLFFDILHSFYMENRMKQISSEVFEELVNRKTGKDFHWFFAQYLHNRFTPELEYCVKDGMVYYRWNPAYTNSDFTKLQLRAIGIITAEPHARVDYSGTFEAGKITPTFQVQSFTLQTGNKVMFDDREALFKATENKSLAKKFEQQFKK